jgi:hypothetical protein
MNEPMIYTTLGNVPASQLTYQTEWDDKPEYTKFTERYLLNGEVVKESAHVYSRVGVFGDAVAASLG